MPSGNRFLTSDIDIAVVLAADVGSSTPKIQRPPPPAEVTTAATTRAKSTVKAEACTPKVQGSSSTRSKTVQPSNLKQSSLALKKKSAIK